MAQMIPGIQTMEDFNWSLGEQRLYECLSQLPKEYVFFHSARWNEKRRRNEFSNREYLEWREADFVVFYPPRGILIVEVKDGPVYFHQNTGWHQENRRTHEVYSIDPMYQAQQSMFYFRKRLAKALPETRYTINTAVWFTASESNCISGTLPNNYQPGTLLWGSDLVNPTQAEAALRKVFDYYDMHYAHPDSKTTDAVINAIMPEFGVFPSIRATHLAAETLFSKMTREQSFLLDYLEEQQIAAIHGGAGTGKTMLAIQKAQRLAEDTQVLFLCFNAFLRDHLKANNKCANLTITNLDSLYSQLTRKPLPYGNERAAEKENALTELLMDWSSYSLPYKHIIIDEGQDFASDHLRLLHDIAEEQHGCFYVFYDKHQFVQGRTFPEWLNDMDCRLVLARNCRNTHEIALTSTRPIELDESKVKTRYDSVGNALTFSKPRLHIARSKEMLLFSLDKLIDKYLKAGLSRDDIVVLSMKSEGQSLLSSSDTVWSKHLFSATKEKGRIWMTTVRKFKGLEAETVICVDVDAECFTNDRQRNAFYVGTSRAKLYLEMIALLPEESDMLAFATSLSGSPVATKARALTTIGSQLKAKIGTTKDLED